MSRMERVPESTELMTDAEQAQAYAGADLRRFNSTLPEEFQRHFAHFTGGRVLDLGCGTADITIRLAQACPGMTLVGVDGSPAMLELGRNAIEEHGLQARIELRQGYLPDANLEADAYDAVVANSLLHHLAEPDVLWRTIRDCARQGAPVLVVDLVRPDDPEQARALVEAYAGKGREIVKQDLFNSLCAAYSVEDVRGQLREAGMSWMQVEAVSELQWKAWGWVSR